MLLYDYVLFSKAIYTPMEELFFKAELEQLKKKSLGF